MAEVISELIFEVLKSVQARLAQVDGKVAELKHEMQAFRTQLIGSHQELGGIRHENRLDCIEQRLELSVVPSP